MNKLTNFSIGFFFGLVALCTSYIFDLILPNGIFSISSRQISWVSFWIFIILVPVLIFFIPKRVKTKKRIINSCFSLIGIVLSIIIGGFSWLSFCCLGCVNITCSAKYYIILWVCLGLNLIYWIFLALKKFFFK